MNVAWIHLILTPPGMMDPFGTLSGCLDAHLNKKKIIHQSTLQLSEEKIQKIFKKKFTVSNTVNIRMK